MRLRQLVPRSRRRGRQRCLTLLGGLAAALLLAGCGGEENKAAPPALAPVPAFAIGIDERNPHLLAPGDQPAPFDRFRDALVALEPSYVRVLVDWSTIQESAAAPPDFASAEDGCVRGQPPCAPYAGIRDTLRGVAALPARPVILIYGTPEWAASEPEGCERDGVTPWGRMPDREAYRTLVRAIVRMAEDEGIEIAYFSPWNEPNTPTFLNPQRRACTIESRSLAVDRYAELVRIMADEVGLERVLLGETAGIARHTRATGAAEMAAALPSDLVCGAAAWAQHAYVTSPLDEGRDYKAVARRDNAKVIGGVIDALDSHGCDDEVPVWITETGAGGRPGACPAMAAQLRDWRRNPRIKAAFQYSMRDDPIFPVGLADVRLTRLYPAYEAWRTRGASC